MHRPHQHLVVAGEGAFRYELIARTRCRIDDLVALLVTATVNLSEELDEFVRLLRLRLLAGGILRRVLLAMVLID